MKWRVTPELSSGRAPGLARTHWANPCYGPSLIREREGFAPAVFADLTGDHLAGFRWLEQRAHSAAINAVWRVLIFSLLPRHFFRCFGPRNTQHKPSRDSLDN